MATDNNEQQQAPTAPPPGAIELRGTNLTQQEGGHDAQRITMVHGHGVRRFLNEMLIPQMIAAGRIGPGKEFANPAAFEAWFRQENQDVFRRIENGHYVECDGTEASFTGALIPRGAEVVLPQGVQFYDTHDCEVPSPVVQQAAETAPPPPPPPTEAVRERAPVEFARRAVPATDGRNWQVGSELHALELLARSGLVPRFTQEWYSLESVSARHPVWRESQSGQVGDTRAGDGRQDGDHLLEGDRFLGSSESSRDDDNTRRRRSTTGDGAIDGPRERGFVAGHIAEIEGDGDMIRAEEMPIEWARGGNYRYNLLGVLPIPLGNMLGLPVGALATSPQDQMPAPAEVRRWGIAQTDVALSQNAIGGYDNAFRDEQALMTGPMETADRIYAFMYLKNAEREFVLAMREVDSETDPVRRQQAAERALIALRDRGDNALIRRVDSLQIPLEQTERGVRDYFRAQGIEIDDARIQAAPRLEVRDMPQEQLEQQQAYESRRDSRYATIRPGETNAAYEAAERYAYRTMNSFEAVMARGEAPERTEAEMIAESRQAWQNILANPNAATAIAQGIAADQSMATHFGMMLADMTRNPAAYGFRSRREAVEYVRRFTGGDEAVERELLADGSTSALPFFGEDERYAMQNPETFGRAAAAAIQSDPALLQDAINRATDPALGADEEGRSDGRRYGIALLQSLGSQPVTGADGTVPPMYAAVAAALGDGPEEAQVRQAVLAATTYAEIGASGRSVAAVQDLDNTYTQGQLAQTGSDDRMGGVSEERRAAIAEAIRSGDANRVYDVVFQTTGARQTAVQGLTARPPLARDAVLLTLARNPEAFNAAIQRLEDLSNSVKGEERYGRLASRLKQARAEAREYQRTGDIDDLRDAAEDLGDFFQNMMDGPNDNAAALRYNAWNAFIGIVGNDPEASAALIEASRSDPEIRNAMLRSVPDFIAATDGVRHGPRGSMGRGNQLPEGMEGDQVYRARYFTMPLNDEGEVRGDGWFSFLGIGEVDVDVNVEALERAVTGRATEPAPVVQRAAPDAPSQPAAPAAPQPELGASSGTIRLPGNRGLLTLQRLPGETDESLAARLRGAAGVSPEVAEQARAVATPAIDRGATLGDVLNTSPVTIQLGGGEDQVASLAAWMRAQGRPLPSGVNSYEDLARASLDAGLITMGGTAEALVATPNSEALNASIAQGSQLPRAAGIAAWWLALPFMGGGGGGGSGLLPFNPPGHCPGVCI